MLYVYMCIYIYIYVYVFVFICSRIHIAMSSYICTAMGVALLKIWAAGPRRTSTCASSGAFYYMCVYIYIYL